MKTNYDIMKELVMDQDLTTEVKLKDLYELLCDNEKLREKVEKLEERNRLPEENVKRDDGFYILQNKINKKLSRDAFITGSDINKYWDECYYESEEDEQDTIDRIREELGVKHEYNVLPCAEPKGLWPNGERIPLELSGLRFYNCFIYHALKRAGIKYIEELRDKTYEWFTSLPHIGKYRADKLQDCLYRTWGFKLKEE